MNPAEAVEVLSLLAAPQALGYHWGTFQLTDEGAETPAHDLTPQNWKLAHPFRRALGIRLREGNLPKLVPRLRQLCHGSRAALTGPGF
jgi:hypothetical protein